MNTKTLYIYDSFILFKILEEIKNNLSFDIIHLTKKEYQNTDFDKISNYLIISTVYNKEINNLLVFNKKHNNHSISDLGLSKSLSLKNCSPHLIMSINLHDLGIVLFKYLYLRIFSSHDCLLVG